MLNLYRIRIPRSGFADYAQFENTPNSKKATRFAHLRSADCH